jgi:hypothetical protein
MQIFYDYAYRRYFDKIKKDFKMKIQYSTLLMAIIVPFTLTHANEVSLIPPNAQAGECYARVVLPAKYEDVEEQVIVKEASEEVTIVPAEYETVKQEVEVISASKKITPVPPEYKKIKETIKVKSASRIWKTGLKNKSLPVNPKMIDMLKTSGINIANVQPGDCFKEYFVPRKFKTVSKELLIRAEHNTSKIVPPKFEEIEQTVIIKPASKKVVKVPAVYESIEEKVLIEAAKTVWKKGQNPAQKVSGATGEIMCLVKVPAKYKTIKKRIIKMPATTKIVEIPEETKMMSIKKLVVDSKVENVLIPALHKTIEMVELENEASFSWYSTQDEAVKGFHYTGHQVCLTEEAPKEKEITKIIIDAPANAEEKIAPAVTKVVLVQKLISPEKELKTPIEAEYKTVKKRKKVSDTHIEWQRILCQTNMTKDIISKLQDALNEKGYSAGHPDGVLGSGSRRALNKFQKTNGLATGGITYETLNALGIKL